MRKEIEKRLITLALNINQACKTLDNSFLCQHLTMQILRSATSAALNYGEAQSSESKKDFVHKTSIVLKELRETYINLMMLKSLSRQNKALIDQCFDECNQLVAIFHKTVISAKRNIHKNPSLEN